MSVRFSCDATTSANHTDADRSACPERMRRVLYCVGKRSFRECFCQVTTESNQGVSDKQTPARLTTKESMILAAFSVLYTINIAVSNISLQLVTVPVSRLTPIQERQLTSQFHQVVRASTPLFTIIISTVVLRTRFSAMKLVSLLPVVAGVGFA